MKQMTAEENGFHIHVSKDRQTDCTCVKCKLEGLRNIGRQFERQFWGRNRHGHKKTEKSHFIQKITVKVKVKV